MKAFPNQSTQSQMSKKKTLITLKYIYISSKERKVNQSKAHKIENHDRVFFNLALG